MSKFYRVAAKIIKVYVVEVENDSSEEDAASVVMDRLGLEPSVTLNTHLVETDALSSELRFADEVFYITEKNEEIL